MFREFKAEKFYLGRVPHDSDLLEFLQDYVIKKNITCGVFDLIGALKKGSIGFYNHEKKDYKIINFNKSLEIISCHGNISLKKGKPFIHAHITLGDSKGRAFGGHLTSGCIVLAAELFLQSLKGEELKRVKDEETSLFLWKI